MPDIEYNVEGHLARITLNRPESFNSFSDEMIDLWTEALEDVRDRDDIYAVLLTGKGRGFCLGGDVKAMAKGHGFFESRDDMFSSALARKNSIWKKVHRVAFTLDQIDKPVVCKINGPATGAGFDMALMCDIRICAKDTKIGETYLNVGLVPGDGGTYFLPRLTSIDKAMDLFWTGKIINGEEAEKLGLVTYAVEREDLDSFTEDYMKKLLSGPQEAIKFTKRNIKYSEKLELRSALDMISSAMGIVTELDDYHKRSKAMAEKLNRKKK